LEVKNRSIVSRVRFLQSFMKGVILNIIPIKGYCLINIDDMRLIFPIP